MAPLVTLLSDFGPAGPYVGAVRGVLLARCPGVVLADITHAVPPQDVLAGAFVLRAAFPWFPPGTVHLAVVDPGVGGPRRALVARTAEHAFVGPDNGLFTLLYDAGVHDVYEIDPLRLGLDPAHVSPTFHGRDLFAPAAAALARGTDPAAFATPVTDPVRLPLAAPARDGAWLRTPVLHVDTFGNVVTAVTPGVLERLVPGSRGAAALDLPGPWSGTVLAHTFAAGPHGRPFLLWGSSGYLEVVADRQRADRLLGVQAGEALTFAVRG